MLRYRYITTKPILRPVGANGLSIKVSKGVFLGLRIFAFVITLIGVILAVSYESGSWPSLAGFIMINLGGTIFLLERFGSYGIPPGMGVALNPITALLIMYIFRKLISLVYIIYEREGLANEFLNRSSFFASSEKAEIICLLGTISFCLGWYLIARKKTSRFDTPPVGLHLDRQLMAAYVAGLIVFISEIFAPEKVRSFGTLITTTQGLAFGSIFGLLVLSNRFGIGKKSVKFVFLLLVPLSINLLSLGMKSAFFFFILPVMLAYLIKRHRFGIVLLCISAIFMLGFVFPYVSKFRKAMWYQGEKSDVVSIIQDVSQDYKEIGISGVLTDSFETLLKRTGGIGAPGLVVYFADRSGHLGPQFLESLIYAFIPRLVWPNKPAFEPATWFSWYLGYSMSPEEATTATALHIGPELYWMFGWVGLVAGLFFLGAIYCRINSYMLDQIIKSPVMIAAWYSFLVFVAFLEEVRYNSALIGPIILLVNVSILKWILRIMMPRREKNPFQYKGRIMGKPL